MSTVCFRSLLPFPAERRWAADVIISDNVFLGKNVRVLKGVTIGENTVVGSGSTVTHDLPPNIVALGSPAKKIRFL